MSVLKDKRTTSKAEYVNVANQIYVKTVDFLSRVSPRYSPADCGGHRTPGRAGHGSRGGSKQDLSVGPTAQGSAEKPPPGGHGPPFGPGCAPVPLLSNLYCNPQGAFTDGKGHKVPAAEAMRRLDNMSQDLGDLINQETDLLKGVMESDKKRK